MIKYAIPLDEIISKIDDANPTWRTRASQRKQTQIAQKKFEESSSIWSQIKPVFIHLQNKKCIYCERRLPLEEITDDDGNSDIESGKGEWDLEHFRPKGRVTLWKPRAGVSELDFNTGGSDAKGYYWLAYDVENYSASCKTCNSDYKRDIFPISATRDSTVKSVQLHNSSEKPFLCLPIGVNAEDPEEIITFDATTAVPVASSGFARRRALVIIELFRLNMREYLHEQRAGMIVMLGDALQNLEDGNNISKNNQIKDIVLSDSVHHSACSRSFHKLWQSDRLRAKIIHQSCFEYANKLTTVFPADALEV